MSFSNSVPFQSIEFPDQSVKEKLSDVAWSIDDTHVWIARGSSIFAHQPALGKNSVARLSIGPSNLHAHSYLAPILRKILSVPQHPNLVLGGSSMLSLWDVRASEQPIARSKFNRNRIDSGFPIMAMDWVFSSASSSSVHRESDRSRKGSLLLANRRKRLESREDMNVILEESQSDQPRHEKPGPSERSFELERTMTADYFYTLSWEGCLSVFDWRSLSAPLYSLLLSHPNPSTKTAKGLLGYAYNSDLCVTTASLVAKECLWIGTQHGQLLEYKAQDGSSLLSGPSLSDDREASLTLLESHRDYIPILKILPDTRMLVYENGDFHGRQPVKKLHSNLSRITDALSLPQQDSVLILDDTTTSYLLHTKQGKMRAISNPLSACQGAFGHQNHLLALVDSGGCLELIQDFNADKPPVTSL